MSTTVRPCGTTVNAHDCLFESAAMHSSREPSRRVAYREPCELQAGATQPCGATPRSSRLAALRTAELPASRKMHGFGLKPFSVRTEARLCVALFLGKMCGIRTRAYCFVGSRTTHCANIIPTSTCAPRSLRPLLADEIQHAELSFTYRLLNRRKGLRLLTGIPIICTAALARKARTMPHHPLPLTVDDVGVAGCTTTCSFARPAFPPKSGA